MFVFPWTNLHELNLDWILQQVKRLVDSNDEFNDKADYAVETADEAKTIAEQAAQATIPDGAVTTQKLADGAVTTIKIADYAVTAKKLYSLLVSATETDPDSIVNSVWADTTVTIRGGVAFLRISKSLTIPADGAFHEIATFNSDYAPTTLVEVVQILSNNNNPVTVRINSNGTVQVRNSTSAVLTSVGLVALIPFLYKIT